MLHHTLLVMLWNWSVSAPKSDKRYAQILWRHFHLTFRDVNVAPPQGSRCQSLSHMILKSTIPNLVPQRRLSLLNFFFVSKHQKFGNKILMGSLGKQHASPFQAHNSWCNPRNTTAADIRWKPGAFSRHGPWNTPAAGIMSKKKVSESAETYR